jgi:hypothetical protein
MPELIAIREAARRLGVSDTAVRKAIAAGRVKVAGNHEGNGRPLLAWPDCQRDWGANSDASKRTHVGSQGSAKRERYAGPPPPVDEVLTRLEPQPHGGALKRQEKLPEPLAELDAEGGVVIHDRMTLNEAKTAQAIYAARQARIDYEQSVDKLIEAEQVKTRAFRMARAARDSLMTMPDRLAPILASSTDVQEVHRLLLEDIERTCHRIAQEAQAAA